MKKVVAIFINLYQGILNLDSLTNLQDLEFYDSLFPVLKNFSDDGSYSLYTLLNGAIEQPLLDKMFKIMANQGINIEGAVNSIDEVSSLNKELSLSVGVNQADDNLKFIKLVKWEEIEEKLLNKSNFIDRSVKVQRNTSETKIKLALNLDGSGKSKISSGLAFLDHMLNQLSRHGKIDLDLFCDGDLEIDEHHTVEDIAITLGDAFKEALGEKRGIRRYGFALVPMDEVLAQVAIDFSNRPHFEWDVTLSRDTVGSIPSEMFKHFFKSFSDGSRSTLNMKVSGGNSHHQIEALFKAFALAIREAVFKYRDSDALPSTKGVL
jgi:imidazoleglycerol-phosphate dehydratase/histidinol-phosphatase